MSKYEKDVKKKLILKGFQVIKGGWPDFIVFKKHKDKIKDFFLVEVKGKGDSLRPNQSKNHEILKLLGLPIFIDFETESKEYWRHAQRKHRDIKNASATTVKALLEEDKQNKMKKVLLAYREERNKLIQRLKQIDKDYSNKLQKTNFQKFQIVKPILRFLTRKQNEIATLASLGLSNKDISLKQRISVQTVKNHLWVVFRRLNISSRAELKNKRLDKALET